MSKKYQIFISSTFSDLVEERQDVTRSVLDLGHIPSGMEIFPAADVEQFEYIKKVVDEFDYYVLIIGARYGSLDAAGVSFTEKEYDYAVAQGKTVLAFIHNNPASITAKVDVDPNLAAKLAAFREKVSAGRVVKHWSSRDDLKASVIIALTKAFGDLPQVGWIRGNAVASEALLTQINELRDLVDRLRARNVELESQSRPQLAGIASLNETCRIRYTFRVWNRGDFMTHSGAVDLTWAEIFAAAGPVLMRPVIPDVISTAVIQYMRETKGISRDDLALLTTDANVIKVHLMALGLINSEAATSREGGVIEFVSLTPPGRVRLLELLAVRSGSAPGSAVKGLGLAGGPSQSLPPPVLPRLQTQGRHCLTHSGPLFGLSHRTLELFKSACALVA